MDTWAQQIHHMIIKLLPWPLANNYLHIKQTQSIDFELLGE